MFTIRKMAAPSYHIIVKLGEQDVNYEQYTLAPSWEPSEESYVLLLDGKES